MIEVKSAVLALHINGATLLSGTLK
jgi:hypothetical protein